MKLNKAGIIAFLILCLVHVTNAQKTLSQAAIKDFASACEFQSRYNQNQNFLLVTLIQHMALKAGSTDKAYTYMIKTEIDQEARETVLEAFSSVSGNDPDKLYTYLFNWGLSAVNAKQVSDYILKKYSAPSLFSGTKKFSDGVWSYVVTIKQDSITLKLYSSKEAKVKTTVTGKIKDGKIITSDRSYKYENSSLYELNNEGDWNEYKEVK